MRVRPAERSDLPGILAIYNEVVANSTAIYAYDPSTLEERGEWFESRRRQAYPVLVAAEDTEILGFASFADWRAWPGYASTVEHSVHVRAERRRGGVGRALLTALLPLARDLGKHVSIGAIDADNEASLRLHETLGFERVAHFKQVARKFDRWLDLVFVQRVV
jgi:L-amino acid N-acyltransferase YncA